MNNISTSDYHYIIIKKSMCLFLLDIRVYITSNVNTKEIKHNRNKIIITEYKMF